MSTRPSLPGAELLFGNRRPAAAAPEPAPEAPVAAPKHEKITLYLPAELLADVDAYRATLRRDGVRVDRGRIIRECMRLGLARSGELLEDLRRDEA